MTRGKKKVSSVRVALQRAAINLLQNLISSGAVTSPSYSLYLSFTQCCFVLTRLTVLFISTAFCSYSSKRYQKLCSVRILIVF